MNLKTDLIISNFVLNSINFFINKLYKNINKNNKILRQQPKQNYYPSFYTRCVYFTKNVCLKFESICLKSPI